MKAPFAIALLLACAACSQENAPADELVEQAGEIVAPEATPSPLAEGPYAPRDTCGDLEGADEFRRQLATAVEQRDADLLVGLAANDIRLDFGGGGGAVELGRRLADESLGLWDELDQLTIMGCAANAQGGITIPWIFEQDLGDVDPFFSMLVTGEDVPVLDTADGDGRRLATVSWDMVAVDSLRPDAPYQRIELADGTTGFIATDKLRSNLDYRLLASSRNGRWRITSFVAGD